MSRIEHSPGIAMEITRCFDCGRFYGYEVRDLYSPCPRCAAVRTEKLADEVARLERSNRALRAAATRRKRGGQ